MTLPERILLASGNAHKLAELTELLAPLGVTVLAPRDVGGLPHVEETGATFAENADLKSLSAAAATGEWALADDSGLAVDALGGEPGVHSARYAGEHGDDEANNARLLAELEGVPDERRGARFVCALSLARPGVSGPEVVERITGETHGRVLHGPGGTNGFGYDPLFRFTEPGHPQTGRCFAALSRDEKAEVSHRGRALRALAARLSSELRSV